jgi:hypothetical protein
MAQAEVRPDKTFHSIPPGLKFNVRVRAIDGNGNRGEYSDPVQVIVGQTGRSQLTMSAITVIGFPTYAVRVSWNSVQGAEGYVLYATKGVSPDDPDINDRSQIAYSGPGLEAIIAAEAGHTVKVRAVCYDETGWRSSNYTEDSSEVGTPA